MIVLKPRVKALFTSTVQSFKDADIDLEPEDVIWLYHLSERCVMPNKYEPPMFVDVPIKIDSVCFWPPTIQAYMWLEDYAFVWWSDDEDMDLLSVGYALAHAKDKEAFTKLLVRRTAEKVVRRWALWKLHCPKEKLRFVVNKMLGDVDRVETEEDKKKYKYDSGDWGDILALLCSTYQQNADCFLRQYSASTCMGLLKRAQIIQAVKSNGGGVENDDSRRVFHEMRMAINYLRDKYKKEDEEDKVEQRFSVNTEDE